jgi:hypothetical protein
MGIGADHDLAGRSPALFKDHLVADPFVDIVVMDPLLGGKCPHVLVDLCRFERICRDLVVKEHDDTLRIEDVFPAHLVELLDGKRAGNIVNHSPVNRRHDHFACPDIAAAFP